MSTSSTTDTSATTATSKRPYSNLATFQTKFKTEFYKTLRLLFEEYTDSMIRKVLVMPLTASHRSIANQFLARKRGTDPERYFSNLRTFIDLLKIKGRSEELWKPMKDGRSLFGELCLYEKTEYRYYKDPKIRDAHSRFAPPSEVNEVNEYEHDVIYTQMLCEIIDLIPYSVLNGGMLDVSSKDNDKREGRTPIQNIKCSIVWHELIFERLKNFDGFKKA